ncbi:Topless-related protein [Drosera capensis]
MSWVSRELAFLILQFLDEERFKNTVHRLEQESGFFFNMRYFEDLVTGGEWDEVEKYLFGFTKVDDNRYSMKMSFEIRKQKYLKALDRRDRAKAVDILVKDMKIFSAFNEELFMEITQLLTLENFRENEQLSKYGDTKSTRGIILAELKRLIEANPLFRDKLQFPTLKNSRLRTLINQGMEVFHYAEAYLNWLHQLCKNPSPNPDIKMLFVDHTCGPPNGARAPSPMTNAFDECCCTQAKRPSSSRSSWLLEDDLFPCFEQIKPFQPGPAPLPAPLAGWMANPSPVAHPAASAGPMGLVAPNNAALINRPRTPPNNSASMDYQTADSDHSLKSTRPFGVSDELSTLPVNILPVPYYSQSHGQSSYTSEDLPRNAIMNLSQGSAVKSLDFHPLQQVLLLVGTNMGEVMVWELVNVRGSLLKISRSGILLHVQCPLQASLTSDYTASINRVMWIPDGTLFGEELYSCPIFCTVIDFDQGVAYSKHIVHIYSYSANDLKNHLEIEAHVVSVSDLAFSFPSKLCVVTCGEDRVIKVL